MIKNYFKIAWRNLLRNKVFSVINIAGLAVGLAGFMITLLYLNYELSYDRWDKSLDQVYRVSLKLDEEILEQAPAALSSFLRQNYSGAVTATSLQAAGDFEILLSANEKTIYQTGMVMADSLFLKVFPYKMIKGNANLALNSPNAVLLSEEVSRKLFGDDDPVGKPIRMYNAIDGVVTGVFQESNGPSHLTVKLIARDLNEKMNLSWNNYSYQNYLKVQSGIKETEMEDAINLLFYNERIKSEEQNKSYRQYKAEGPKTSLFVDAVSKIHNFPKHGSSNIRTISILMILAILLLIAGAVNFSNLSVAQSVTRAKEVGVRKVLGTDKTKLVIQFMSEAFVYCLLSMILALAVVMLLLPYFNKSFGLELSLWDHAHRGSLILQMATCLAAVTILSGIYPSFFLARFNILRVLKSDYSVGGGRNLFRNALMLLQFVVSAFFIMASVTMNRQMNFIRSVDKGFSGEQVMRIEARQKSREDGFDLIRTRLLAIPGVVSVAKTTKVPGDRGLSMDTSTNRFRHNGAELRMASEKVSTDYFKTMSIGLQQGRLFNESFSDQNTRSAVINAAAARRLGKENPVGKTIYFSGCDTVPITIVGVVNDVNVLGFEMNVQPVVYTIANKACMYQSGGALLVKLNGKDMREQIAGIEKEWKSIEPGAPIRYSFVDDNFQNHFSSYTRLQQVINFFTLVAVLISVMGLLALTAYIVRRRQKEISIRKVLGAGSVQLVTLLIKEFLVVVLVAVLITVPVAIWAMNEWLQSFSYRVQLSWWVFGAAAFFLLLITLFTVSIQTLKSVLMTPVKNLRSE